MIFAFRKANAKIRIDPKAPQVEGILVLGGGVFWKANRSFF